MKSLFHFLAICCCFFSLAGLKAQVVINEYSAANLTEYVDNFGSHDDWIELYNSGNSAIALSGYYLSDNPDNPTKWQVPAGITIAPNSYRTFIASGRDTVVGSNFHTNFKIVQTKNTPETLVLADPSGVILDTAQVKKTQLHHSRGRITDGAADWGIFKDPTRNATNNSEPAYTAYADRPDVDQVAGFYTDNVVVTLTNNEPNSTIYYTLDGKLPTVSSPVYSGPITINATTVLKAYAKSNDNTILPGFIEYATYFINEEHTLPVLSIAGTQLDQLANGNENLRPQGSIEYFDVTGDRKARGYGEYNSHGQDSWVNDQRSLDIVIRDEMGYNNALNEQFFRFTDRDEFQRLILRAGGDDNYPGNFLPEHDGCAHLRDAYVHNLAKRGGLNLDMRVSEKCVIYLNGQYWGVYDLREIPDDHDYTEYYYNQGKFDIQYVLTWGNTWAEYGGNQALEDWDDLKDYILGNNMAVQANYDFVDSQFDVKSLVDYVIVNSVSVCSDWLNYNTGIWRGFNPEGTHQKWGYILWDNDATFGYYINYTGIPDTSATADPCNVEDITSFWSDPERHIAILKKLRQNPAFDQYYISRYIDLMNNVFSCDNMLSYLDTVTSYIDPEMPRHIERWGGSYDDWQQNVARLRGSISNRCAALDEGLADCYDLTGPYEVTFTGDPVEELTGLKINSLDITTLPYTGLYYGGIDILLEGKQTPGSNMVFSNWTSVSGIFAPYDTLLVTQLNITGSDTIVAHFGELPVGTTLPEVLTPVISVYPTIIEDVTNITLHLPGNATVALHLYNTAGTEIAIEGFNTQQLAAGQHSAQLNLANAGLISGIYMLAVDVNGERQVFKLVYQH